MWFLYVLKCCDDSLYTGITKDLEKRLKQHQSGKGAKYTRAKLPVEMMSYTAVSCDQGEALKKEYEFKQLTKKQKLKFISLGLSSFLYKQSFNKKPIEMNEQNDGVNETHQ